MAIVTNTPQRLKTGFVVQGHISHYMNHKALISTCDERSEDEAVCEMQAATSLDSHDLGDKDTGPKQCQNCHITPMNSLIHRKGPFSEAGSKVLCG